MDDKLWIFFTTYAGEIGPNNHKEVNWTEKNRLNENKTKTLKGLCYKDS
jgi:hypothetical protein